MPKPLCLALLASLLTAPAFAADPTYWQDVRPILRKHCTVCHSQRSLKEIEISGGLALDSYEAVTKNKKPLLHSGKSSESLLIQLLVTSDENRRMPLGVKPLDPAQIDVLRRWVDTGAREGQPTTSGETATTVKLPPRRRKLDVVLSTTTTPPAGALGTAKPAPLQLRLAVGPLSPVTAVAFSPDGKLLATGSYGIVSLWALEKGQPARTLTSVLGTVNDLAFSPDGSLLAVAGGQPSARGDLRLFQVSDGKLLASLAGHGDVVASVAFSPDGKLLASASFDRTARIWDVASRQMKQELTGHSDFVYALDFAPDGKLLASVSKDRSVKVVESATGTSYRTFSGMNDDVLAVAFHPGGKTIVSSGHEAGLYWWDLESAARTRLQGGHRIAVNELTFSADGKLLASGSSDGTVKLWDGGSGALKTTLQAGALVYAVDLSRDGQRVAAGCFDGLVRVWDVASSRQLATLLTLPPYSGEIEWLALTPEGYATGHPGLTAAGRWLMGTQAVEADSVWKALAQPEQVASILKGEKPAAPTFGK